MSAKEVSVLIERSDGATFRAGTGQGWRIPANGMKDWGELDYQVSTAPNVLTDGSSLVSKRVAERDRTLRAVYVGVDADAERARAVAFFNPKFTFKAHVTYRGATRWVSGEQMAFQAPPLNVYQQPEITWTLLCLDPYYRGEDGNESAFGDSVPMFGFPFVSHVQEELSDGTKHPVGFMASELIFDGKNTVWNNGDVETFYRIVVKAGGLLENPTITKDGRFVRLLDTLRNGDEYVIDFEQSPPKVTINGENVIQRVSRDSSFTNMKMQVGKNIFSFTVDNEENRSLADVQVLFHEKYLGV